MPVITVNWWQGDHRDTRRELVAGITDAVTRVTGCPDGAVTVIVRDVAAGHRERTGRIADQSRPVRGRR